MRADACVADDRVVGHHGHTCRQHVFADLHGFADLAIYSLVPSSSIAMTTLMAMAMQPMDYPDTATGMLIRVRRP